MPAADVPDGINRAAWLQNAGGPVDAARRRWVRRLGALGAVLLPAAAAGERLRRPTPAQVPGPFRPLELPADHDNDLTTVQGHPGVAQGSIVEVNGQVLLPSGLPVAGARVLLWQVNGHGRYHHPDDDTDTPLDPCFQGCGVTLTDALGRYRFRTIRPPAYAGRAPHMHLAVDAGRGRSLVTQLYLAGDPGNAGDGLLGALDPEARERLMVRFAPAGGSGVPSGRFDVVLGAETIR